MFKQLVKDMERDINDFGRIWWHIRNTNARTQQIVTILNEYRETHPIRTIDNGQDDTIILSYQDRQGGWVIERVGWKDPETGEILNDKALLIAVRSTTRKPTSVGNIEVRLSDTSSESQNLFIQLADYLENQFPSATLHNMLDAERIAREPYDPWQYCEIKDTFTISQSSDWLIKCMRESGIKIEANGGINFKSGFNMRYKVNSIPEVNQENDSIMLTWLYAYDSFMTPTSKPDLQCILWKVIEHQSQTQIIAYCKQQIFSTTFYQMISYAKSESDRASKRQLNKISQTADIGVFDELSREENSEVYTSARAGRPALLCNLWAFAEKHLGRTPDLREWQRLYEMEKGHEFDHADPQKSMENGIRSIARKYRK